MASDQLGCNPSLMVAYSFKKHFAPKILDGSKRQTIRGHRKRHAWPGEPLQLYQGMRTKYCKKILDPDPVCLAVLPIWIDVPKCSEPCRIQVGEHPEQWLDDAFAIADGFDNARAMIKFWIDNHDPGRFDGVLIRWELQVR
ncbi:MAG: ASCH domain-containing protein [Pseudomonadota bacterium]